MYVAYADRERLRSFNFPFPEESRWPARHYYLLAPPPFKSLDETTWVSYSPPSFFDGPPIFQNFPSFFFFFLFVFNIVFVEK